MLDSFFRYFDDFVNCIMGGMEAQQLTCNYTDIKRMIAERTRYMTNYDWNYYDRCQRK